MGAADIIGWIGSFLILLAYYLVSSKRVKGDSFIYQFLNLAGAIGLIWISVVRAAWPLAFLDMVWAAIAGIALYGIVVKRKGGEKTAT